MSGHFIVLCLAAILCLGILAQWTAYLSRLPAILVLLVLGLIVGPGIRWWQGPEAAFLNPDLLFGPLLQPLVGLAVCVILYEGGLTLKFREIEKVGKVVRNLVTVGMFVTWILCALLAKALLGLSTSQSFLLGAILVVTGPTVVGPLLRQVRPRGAVASVLKWEGIVIDPIGALLAVLVYEAIHVHGDGGLIAQSIVLTAVVGGLLGFFGARLLVVLIKRHMLPTTLDNPASLALVIGVFVLSNHIQEESGLLAATVMGIVLANQRTVPVHHLVEFKENLRVLLISTLFIVLAARLKGEHLSELTRPGAIEFLLLLLFVVRPAAAFISTIKSPLSWKERAFVAFLAPRGIVAAAVASQLALTLAQGDPPEPGAERLVAITFMVIISTVAIYGLAAAPLAHRLGLADRDPQGVLILGAHPWARELALAIQAEGFRVLMLDINQENVDLAREAGLDAEHGDALADHVIEELDLGGIGRFLALTPNDEVNTMATDHFLEVFGRREVYRLISERTSDGPTHSRDLFKPDLKMKELYKLRSKGASFARSEVTPDLRTRTSGRLVLPDDAESIPIFLVNRGGKRLQVITTDARVTPQPGDVLVKFEVPSGPSPETSETDGPSAF